MRLGLTLSLGSRKAAPYVPPVAPVIAYNSGTSTFYNVDTLGGQWVIDGVNTGPSNATSLAYVQATMEGRYIAQKIGGVLSNVIVIEAENPVTLINFNQPDGTKLSAYPTTPLTLRGGTTGEKDGYTCQSNQMQTTAQSSSVRAIATRSTGSTEHYAEYKTTGATPPELITCAVDENTFLATNAQDMSAGRWFVFAYIANGGYNQGINQAPNGFQVPGSAAVGQVVRTVIQNGKWQFRVNGQPYAKSISYGADAEPGDVWYDLPAGLVSAGGQEVGLLNPYSAAACDDFRYQSLSKPITLSTATVTKTITDGVTEQTLTLTGTATPNSLNNAVVFLRDEDTGELLRGWTAYAGPPGAPGGAFTVAVTHVEAFNGRNIGAYLSDSTTRSRTTHILKSIPIFSAQKMRVSMNDSPWNYFDGNTPFRDLAKSAQMTLSPLTDLYGSYRSSVVGPGDVPGRWSNWGEEYNPAISYPNSDGASGNQGNQNGLRCMYAEMQWEAVNPANGSIPPGNPPILDAIGPYWRPANFVARDLVCDPTTGLIVRHPVDASREIQFELPWVFPEAKYPFTINGAATDGYGNPVPGGKFKFRLPPEATLTSENVAAGTFVITVTGDNVDGAGNTLRILIDRTGPVIPQPQFIPSYEVGNTGLCGSVHLADMAVFFDAPRDMQAVDINQDITLYNKPTLARRLKPAAVGWRGEGQWEYQVERANKLGKNMPYNIPYFAEPDYIEAHAVFVRDNLNPALIFKPENVNENWQNGLADFDHGNLINIEAASAGLSKMLYCSRMHRERMEIYYDVFAGQTHRLAPTFAWQSFCPPSQWAEALNFENCYQYVGALAMAPYHSGDVMNWDYASAGVKAAVAANDYPAFIVAMTADIMAGHVLATSGMTPVYDWLPLYNVSKGLHKDAIQLESYEWHHHVYVKGAWPDLTRAKTFFNNFKYSSHMSELTAVGLDMFAANCPHNVRFFLYTSLYGRSAAQRLTANAGFSAMRKTGNLTDHPMAGIVERAAHYNAL